MKFQIGAMSAGDILDRGLKLMMARLPVFFLINLIILAPVLVIQLVLPLLTETNAPPTADAAVAVLGASLLLLILTLILQPFATAAILHIISQEFVGGRPSMGEAFQFALRRFGSLLGASIMAGLVMFLGFIMCLVPGFIFFTWYVFVGQVVVVEGLGASDSLPRSKALTAGYRGRIFGLFVLFFVASLILGWGVGLLERIAPSAEIVRTATGDRMIYHRGLQVTYAGIQVLINILVQTYSAVCWTLLYFDLRIRKEGFDLELAAKEQVKALS